jgi:predicted transglutaminase-like cysteine proteinase
MRSRTVLYSVVVGCAVAVFAAGAQAATGKKAVKSIFGTTEIAFQGLDKFPKWTGALERYLEDKAASGDCSDPNDSGCNLKKWQAFIEETRSLGPEEQLATVNDFMNEHDYIVDPINWGAKDHWASPRQFFEKYGDCEDYAIAKYLTLRALGWDPAKLRVVVLIDTNLKVPHAILTVVDDEKMLVLDNQFQKVVESGRIKHYRPIFSLNEEGWWRHRSKRLARRKKTKTH